MSHTNPRGALLAVREEDLWFSDVSTGNASGSKHGLCPKIGTGLSVTGGVLNSTATGGGTSGSVALMFLLGF